MFLGPKKQSTPGVFPEYSRASASIPILIDVPLCQTSEFSVSSTSSSSAPTKSKLSCYRVHTYTSPSAYPATYILNIHLRVLHMLQSGAPTSQKAIDVISSYFTMPRRWWLPRKCIEEDGAAARRNQYLEERRQEGRAIMEEDTSNDQKEDGENIDIWKVAGPVPRTLYWRRQREHSQIQQVPLAFFAEMPYWPSSSERLAFFRTFSLVNPS